MSPNPELRRQMDVLNARAREYTEMRIAEKEFRISCLEAEIKDLRTQIMILRSDLSE